VRIGRSTGPWFIALAEQKLAWRATLPGAFTFDQAAHSFRCARAAGLTLSQLLPGALAASWLVNNRVASTTFQKWLHAPLRERWDELLLLLEGGPDTWLARSAEDRARVAACAEALCVDGHGVAGLSRVAAALVPETVPLMDDAALWFAGEWVGPVDSADKPQAGSQHLLPMLDWFCRTALDVEPALIEIARSHHEAVLDAPQVLDRLVWFESWGYRLSHASSNSGARYWWVRDGEHQAIVPVTGVHPRLPSGACVNVSDVQDAAWAQSARNALDQAAG
jgi:hypothetical protein